MRYFTNKKGTRTKAVSDNRRQLGKTHKTSERFRTRHRKGKRK